MPITTACQQTFSLFNQANDTVCTYTIYNSNSVSGSSWLTWFTRSTICSIITWSTIASRCSSCTRNAFTRIPRRTWPAWFTREPGVTLCTRTASIAFEVTMWRALGAIFDCCSMTFKARWSLRPWVSRGTIISWPSWKTIWTISAFGTRVAFSSLQNVGLNLVLLNIFQN